MPDLELTPSVFAIFSSLIDERSGLHYGLMDRELLQEKAVSRALEAGFSSLLDYYYFLRYDPGGEGELSELIEALVVNETYFFREWPAIRMMVDSIIAPMCAQGHVPRIWSAACATGEEPLSIAMALAQRDLLHRVEIVASDISANALSRAKSGRFSRRSVRSVPEPQLVEAYINPTDFGYAVPGEFLQKIRWEKINLLNSLEVAALGRFDVILCRNVMIYFSDKTVKDVLGRLASALDDKGTLLIGVSESLLRYGTTFVADERDNVFVYKKATGA